MITLYQFHKIWGLPNASPFCMKVETILRMMKLPYAIKSIHNPQYAPKGKLPYIQIEGINYSDSEHIVDLLRNRYGDILDEALTSEQRALMTLVEYTFSERLYWIMIYLRWQDEAGWSQIRTAYFGHLPLPVKLFLPHMVRKKMLKALYYQGNGRHALEEIVGMGKKTLDALATILGNNPYFSGEKPGSVDATAFAFLTNLIMSPLHDPLKNYALSIETFNSYCQRMWDAFYPDFPKP